LIFIDDGDYLEFLRLLIDCGGTSVGRRVL